jgi:zinc transport system substrate-binding protein
MTTKILVRKIFATTVLAVVVAVGVTAALRHASTQRVPDGHLHVVASFYPLQDFARQVGGSRVYVTNMTPGGTEPHDYEPPTKALADAEKAPVFIYNGGQMEPWVQGFLKGYTGVTVKSSNGIELLHAASEDNPDVRVNDPHFWLDPVLAQRIVDNIASGLSTADPVNRSYYLHNATVYKQQLSKLDADFRTGLANCSLHTIVTSHDAFTYLGKRYGLGIQAIAGLSPDEEPSAAKLAQLSDLVRAEHIQYIFFERLASPRLADTIGAETGAKTLVFDPIEGISDADEAHGKNYLSVQRENLASLQTALVCN